MTRLSAVISLCTLGEQAVKAMKTLNREMRMQKNCFMAAQYVLYIKGAVKPPPTDVTKLFNTNKRKYELLFVMTGQAQCTGCVRFKQQLCYTAAIMNIVAGSALQLIADKHILINRTSHTR